MKHLDTNVHHMTHESEMTYQDRVEQWFIENYGEENVDRSHYLSETYRFADFWVEGPLVTFAVEVENDFDAAIKGFGQAYLYAAHDPRAVPVIILPPDHVEQPEADMLRRFVRLAELEV